MQKTLLEQLPQMNETLPSSIIDAFKLLPIRNALINIHFPTDNDILKKALFRLKFEEFFYIQLEMLRNKKIKNEHFQGPAII